MIKNFFKQLWNNIDLKVSDIFYDIKADDSLRKIIEEEIKPELRLVNEITYLPVLNRSWEQHQKLMSLKEKYYPGANPIDFVYKSAPKHLRIEYDFFKEKITQILNEPYKPTSFL